MAHIKEFNKNAHSYAKYNIIQTEVAKELIAKIKSKPRKIVDLGCGSGTVYNTIDWEIDEFIAVDKSEKMLQLHPNKKVTKIHCAIEEFDFTSYKDFFFISSSALQWCKDLDAILQNLTDKNFTFALFSANTFKSLHKCANIKSPILSKQAILDASSNLSPNLHIETKEYKLHFDSTLQMLRYIKKSGVGGGKNILSYKQIKSLLQNYDKNYLEFEVVFLYALKAIL